MHEDCAKRERDIAAAWARAEDEVKRLNLQVRELQNALRDVLEISEVEGAVNLTTMESAKLMAARDLVPTTNEKRICESRTGTNDQLRCVLELGHIGFHSDGRQIAWDGK